MELSFKHSDGIPVFSIGGELDAGTAPRVTRYFEEKIIELSPFIVADLKELNYSSSAGIRVFLGMAREARQRGGDLRIAAVANQVDKVFRLSKFDKIVQIYPTVEDALSSFQTAP